MTFWEFLDRQFNRLKVDHVAGAGVFLLTALVLHMIRKEPSLADNDLFKMLAQAIIVQGLVGLAMAAWFTTRRGDHVTIDNPPSDPVPTTTEDK
jgi:heme A synthase